MSAIRLKGSDARNFFAEQMVEEHGEAARDKCCGPMLAAVEKELERRALAAKEAK